MWNLLSIAALIYSFYFMDKVKKSGKKGGLTQDEKIQVIITEVLSPILAGAIYYYGWRKTHPEKAKTANKYSWIIFLILLILGFVWVYFNPEYLQQ